MTNINRQLAELIESGTSIDDAVDEVLAAMDPGELMEFVRPLVAMRARAIARSRVRRAEQRAFVAVGGHVRLTAPEELRKLLDETFVVPSTGAVVRWADATPEQHRERAAYLREHATAVMVTAERHDRAAQIIESAKVASLAEVDLEKVAAA